MIRSTADGQQVKGLMRNLLRNFYLVTGTIVLLLMAAIVLNEMEGALAESWATNPKALVAGSVTLCFLCLLLAKQLLHRGVQRAKKTLNTLAGKLNAYRSALVNYLLICELPVLVNIFLFLATANWTFMVLSAVMLGCMLAVYPSRSRLGAQLQISNEEQQQLN